MMILLETKVVSVSTYRTFSLLSKSLLAKALVLGTGHGGGIWIC